MNKIYTFAVPVNKQGYIIDARNAFDWRVVGEVEVYEGMSFTELEREKRNIGIPENAVVISARVV